ncbi:MAG: filamentous hemagglutinin N-terminal domain-containing protein, partial [Burkholderiaceae bacterium]|nr:filamentous hemagglutinin N-terminal domain-containing protein [Burkholderiaceae bacterium]
MRRATRLKAVYPVSIVVEAGTSPSRRRLRPALLALSIAAAFTSLPIASQGILPVHRADVVGTSARAVNAAGTQLTVTTTNGVGANHSAINWQSFSIGAGNTTQFVQPSANSTSINRVVTNTPSQIYGTLSSNGKLVLVNQSGITVGAGAVVDTAGFTASVLGMSEVDAAAARLRFSADSLGNGTGALVVQGNVIARGGDVVLIAPSIEVAKTAVVESQGGAVILAAGQKVEVTGRGLEGIVMQVQAPGDSAVNLGTLRGDAVGIFASQLKHSGLIQAVGVTSVGGKVLLQANDLAEITGRIEAQRITTAGSNGGDVTVKAGYAVVTGAIDASGQRGGSVTIDAQAVLQAAPISVAGVTSGGVVLVRGTGSVVQTAEAVIQADGAQGAGGSVTVQAGADGTVLSSATVTAGGNTGGTVQILGGTLRLQAAQISADGDEAGGTLLVGGDRHGNNPFVPNSKYLYVNSASMLSASSRRRGNGGTVVLWSDGTTRFFGDIQAHGAGSGKAGGWVEVSGKDAVQYGGTVNAAGGPGGADGTLLLDPKNITIGAAPGQLGVIELVDPNHEASGAGDFGATILESGASRVLVTDPSDNHGSTAASNSGAIYVYDKTSGSLLTAITGSASGDNVGQNYQSLGTNRYVFQSATAAGGAGAWTWIDIGSSSVLPTSGVASAANSLVGISAGDLNGATLSSASSRMLFIAPNYAGTRGAFTTLPTTGFVGTLGSANAVLGDVAGDQLGSGRYRSLYDGSIAVLSPNWGGNRGAITIIDTTLPVNGNITVSNSLVGLTGSDTMGGTGDQVGSSSGRIVQLSNNSVFVFTPNWGGGKGAVSVFDTPATVTGTVTGGNSLTGSTPTDGQNFSVQSCYFYGYCYPASYGYRADYLLVTNPQWNGGMGSVTVLDQTLTAASHPVGTLAPGNSLIGGTGDQIGSGGVTVYGSKLLVSSPSWGSGNGALTFINATSSSVKGLVNISEPNSVVGTAFGDFNSMTLREDAVSGKLLLIAPYYGSGKGAMALLGDSGVNGVLDDGKALIGTTAGDYVGSGSLTIAGGNWILKSPSWQSNTGAVTIFKPGVTSTSPRGFVKSTLNSWTGAAAGDRVGSAGMTFTLFGNNNAVMVNPLWGSGLAATGPGAITLITNIAMPYGVVSGANSWTGMPGSSDGAGMTVQALSSDGQGTNYSPGSTTRVVVSNPGFNQNRGFVALIKDTDTSLVYPGTISSSNSLVGLTGADTMGGIGDQIGSFVGSVYGSLTGGKLVINSPRWNNKQGAITFFNLDTGTLLPGSVNSGNSLVGIGANDLATGSVNLYVQNSYGVNNGLTNLGGAIASGHVLLVASAYGGGKGAIVNIDLNAPVTGTLNSATNALMGAATTDRIGSGGVIRQYYAPGPGQRVLVFSPSLSSQAGGITSIDTAAVSPIGVLNATNSLIGASAGDQVGFGGSVTQLSNGSLLFLTPAYANGTVTSAGAITLMLDPANVKGTVNAANSLVGTTGGDLGGSYVTTGPGNTAFVRLPNWTNTAS